MPRRDMLAPSQRAEFTEVPTDLSPRLLVRHYTLTPADLTVIKRRVGAPNRMGYALQICYLRYPGRPLAADEVVPAALVAFVAAQIGCDGAAFAQYARDRATTRREHYADILIHLGVTPFRLAAYRALSQWLLPLALNNTTGMALIAALVEELRVRKIVQPAILTLERLAWAVRRRAQQKIYAQLTTGLTPPQQAQLDSLLSISQDKRQTDLAWLRRPTGANSPSSFLGIVKRLEHIRAFGLDATILQTIHQNWVRQLAREGARHTPQHLERLETVQRYAILVVSVVDMAERLTDQAVEMHCALIGQLFTKSERQHGADFQKSGKTINSHMRQYVQVGKALIAAKDAQTDAFAAIETTLGWDTFVQSISDAEKLVRPPDFDYLDLLENRYSWIRQYAPTLLKTFTFTAAKPADDLIAALTLLAELNTSGKRTVGDAAPRGFIRPRWDPYIFTEAGIDRHYYEMAALTELRHMLRSGDVWVAGSRQFKDFDTYLMPESAWQKMRTDATIPVAIPTDVKTYMRQRTDQLHTALTTVAAAITAGELPELTLDAGDFHITPLHKDIPDGVEALKQKAYDVLPRIKLSALFEEVDSWTQFSRHFTHLRTGEETSDTVALYSALLADAINLGLTKMADSTPDMTFNRLAWVNDWHIRDDTYKKALAEVVNYQHRLPFAAHWGDGTTSSSDGQRFQAGGPREPTAQVNAKYGPEPGIMVYTLLSDQYAPFSVTVISATVRQAPYILDGLLYHDTVLQITEHYADTHGYTDHLFGIIPMFGFRFAPPDQGHRR